MSAADAALAALVTALLVAEAWALAAGSPVPAVLACVQGLSVAFRRRFPLGCYVASTAAMLVLAAFFYEAGLYPVPNLIVLYAVGAHATRTRSVAGLLLGLAAVVAYWVMVPPAEVPWLPGLLVAAWALAWVAGQAERQRRRAAADVVRRAQEGEARRAEERRAAVADERSRLSREVHDIVGHALNVMVLQAGAGRRMLDRDPAATAAALATVETVGRDALTELDWALERLESPAPRQPTAGMASLEEMAARFTAAGVPVSVHVDGAPTDLAASVDLAVYRVVQESLTNVAKHAPGQAARVEITVTDDALLVAVHDRGNAASPAAAGRGLAGIRDRVAALGGTTVAGRDPEGGWSVRCRIPTRS